ncbi:pancreatic triacylglycerol lipase-like [Scaptodrosophila lebanonensis]|uniref:Pancreatic triacylglycerol lipase-like n=1 Tax=Drosophila lebanonensis TaxID=7225 RepID=A0A6J2TTX0_DROLE|nr:pancreatic triacylglycerol lipase-like [Scaptodrosophila lebanonensis]
MQQKICKCLLVVLLIAHIKYASSSYRNRLGDCEPFTIEFIAGLIQKKARQLLEPFASLPYKRMLRFELYTRKNPHDHQVLRTGDRSRLTGSNFDAAWPVRFSIHGWNGQTRTCSNAAIKDAYLYKGNFNVVLVDWSDYSLDINYFRVIAELFEMADQINDFARFLHTETGVPYSKMYLIGHSLGCHLAGIAGKRLRPDRYGAIFALDSAGPILNHLNETWHLAPSDAMYVESIQTDLSFFGYRGAHLAHATFFPNWGLGQPHCPNATAMEPDFVCDHFSSLYYFVESLHDDKAFGGFRCKNFKSIVEQKCSCGHEECEAQAYMGGEPAVPKRGIYYLSTRPKRPFGYGKTFRMRRALQPTTTRTR